MPHKKLQVWQKSMDIVEEIYSITKKFPREEIFGLTQQMRRSAISIPSNIAEGCSRKGVLETTQFLYIATASLSELETQILISERIAYLSDIATEEIIFKLEEIKRMLVGLIKSYKSK